MKTTEHQSIADLLERQNVAGAVHALTVSASDTPPMPKSGAAVVPVGQRRCISCGQIFEANPTNFPSTSSTLGYRCIGCYRENAGLPRVRPVVRAKTPVVTKTPLEVMRPDPAPSVSAPSVAGSTPPLPTPTKGTKTMTTTTTRIRLNHLLAAIQAIDKRRAPGASIGTKTIVAELGGEKLTPTTAEHFERLIGLGYINKVSDESGKKVEEFVWRLTPVGRMVDATKTIKDVAIVDPGTEKSSYEVPSFRTVAATPIVAAKREVSQATQAKQAHASSTPAGGEAASTPTVVKASPRSPASATAAPERETPTQAFEFLDIPSIKDFKCAMTAEGALLLQVPQLGLLTVPEPAALKVGELLAAMPGRETPTHAFEFLDIPTIKDFKCAMTTEGALLLQVPRLGLLTVPVLATRKIGELLAVRAGQ